MTRTYTVEDITQGYVALRDKISERKEEHAAELAPLQANLERLNTALLKHLLDNKVESVKTAKGTFYKINHASVTVEDPGLFRGWVTDRAAWNLVDFRANKPGVQGYVGAHKAPPPGVKYSEYMEAGVRRPAGLSEEDGT